MPYVPTVGQLQNFHPLLIVHGATAHSSIFCSSPPFSPLPADRTRPSNVERWLPPQVLIYGMRATRTPATSSRRDQSRRPPMPLPWFPTTSVALSTPRRTPPPAPTRTPPPAPTRTPRLHPREHHCPHPRKRRRPYQGNILIYKPSQWWKLQVLRVFVALCHHLGCRQCGVMLSYPFRSRLMLISEIMRSIP
jgi:hypothetical protein